MSPLSMKSVGGALLVVVAIGAIAVGLRRQAQRSATEAAANSSSTSAVEAPEGDAVTVYYFHGDQRCATCIAIEAQTRSAVEENFADELAAQKLSFESVNYEAPGNTHFQTDYELAFSSVVVQGGGADRPWENLADVWTLVHGEASAFEGYIVEHVRKMLEPAG